MTYTAYSKDGREIEVSHPNPRNDGDERIKNSAFGCPKYIDKLLTGDDVLLPALRLVRALGPQRCQWIGYPQSEAHNGALRTRTCWSLDGAPASLFDLQKATRTANGGVSRAAGPVEPCSRPTPSSLPVGQTEGAVKQPSPSFSDERLQLIADDLL